MRSHPRRTWRSLRVRMPRRTIRMRLTLVYWGLFVASGAALLVVTVALWQGSTGGAFPPVPPWLSGHLPERSPLPPAYDQRAIGEVQHRFDLDHLLVVSAIALGFMAVLAIAIGWLIVGRYLQPLRAITAAARTISATELDERLNLGGPDDELKELGDTFDDLLGRLDRSFRSQRQFAASAAHELRTPHATMRVWLDVAMAKPGPLPPHITDLGDRLRRELDHVDQLIDGLLVLARAQHDAITDEATLSLDGLVSGAVAAHASAVAEMGLDVSQHECPEAQVTGSTTLLARLVQNVIDNAVRHNCEGGWVRIRTEVTGPAAHLIVENGGPVLRQGDVRLLAQPFRRLGAERTASSTGTGLGLSIVASIAEIHGGRLDLCARPAGGLQVTIKLPAAARKLPAAACATVQTPA
jgi:signal transduction histidine kinase